jgi:hypothetical protein
MKLLKQIGLSVPIVLGCLTASAQETRALVVVNDNSLESQLVGYDYQQRRNVPDDHVVHVLSPTDYFISTADFFSLRDQILRFGICPLVPADKRPADCADPSKPIYTPENIQALTDNAPVSYIVLTRGVPTRFQPPHGGNQSPSVDAYLHYWLARYFDDTSDPDLNSFVERAEAYGITTTMAHVTTDNIRTRLRPVVPAVDREYVIGRLDALDLISAKRLTARAMRAEADGIYGKVYHTLGKAHGGFMRGPGFGYVGSTGLAVSYDDRYTLSMLGESRTECASLSTNYMAVLEDPSSGVVPAAGVTPGSCLVKFSNGYFEPGEGAPVDRAPGTSGSRQPSVDNALVYFGYLDGQNFGDGERLKNWRRNDQCSNVVCDAAADPTACRNASTDVLRVLDTSCVGVPDGALSYNYRSYTASLMGLWPKGWTPHNPEAAIEIPMLPSKSVGRLVFRSPDEAYITPQCWRYGADRLLHLDDACYSTRVLGVQQSVYVGSQAAAAYTLSFQVSSAYQRQASRIQAGLLWRISRTGDTCPTGWNLWADYDCAIWDAKTFDLDGSGELRTATMVFQGPQGVTLRNGVVDLIFSAPDANYFPTNGQIPIQARSVTLTGVSMTAAGSAQNLVINGSFNDADQFNGQTGDYNVAATYLGRLGGTAYWGSVGHHQTGGASFADNETRIFYELLHGVPLGDAVWLRGGGASGILYGDPLYNPASVQLFTPGVDASGRFYKSTPLRVRGLAYNGENSSTTSLWLCPSHDLADCDLSQRWSSVPVSKSIGGYLLTGITVTDALFPKYGAYSLRLTSVTQHPTSGESITINDFANLIYGYLESELPHPLYSVAGLIVDANGIPVRGALVVAVDSQGAQVASLRTSTSGEYSFSLAPGQYVVTASATGFVPSSAAPQLNVSVVDTAVSHADLVLVAQAAMVSGRATWTDNGVARPVAGVRVVATQNGVIQSYARTTADGRYALSGLTTGAYSIGIDATKLYAAGGPYAVGWMASATSINMGSSNQTIDLSLTPAAGAWVAGFIKQPNGQAYAGDVVDVVNCVDGQTYFAWTNVDGHFRVSALPTTGSSATASCPAGQAAVLVEASPFSPGFAQQLSATLVSVNATASPMTMTQTAIVDSSTYSVRGFMLSASTGVGQGNVTVKLINQATGQALTAVSDSSGYYVIANVLNGANTLTTADGKASRVITVKGDMIDANLSW